MTYSISDLEIVKPLDFIRSHPDLFISHVSGAELASSIVAGALVVVPGPVTASQHGEWWIVRADSDWLAASALETPEAVFCSVVAYPEAGANSVHPEVLLTAFAEDVVTVTDEEPRVLKGAVQPGDALWGEIRRGHRGGRVVAFRLK